MVMCPKCKSEIDVEEDELEEGELRIVSGVRR